MTLLLGCGAALAQPAHLSVDASCVTGVIRSPQGMNLGLLHSQTKLPNLTAQYRDLCIDAVRNHDFFGPTDLDSQPKDSGAGLVIFPDWNADASKESSYQFAPSDRVIKGIVDSGAEVCFRLGRGFGVVEDYEASRRKTSNSAGAAPSGDRANRFEAEAGPSAGFLPASRPGACASAHHAIQSGHP